MLFRFRFEIQARRHVKTVALSSLSSLLVRIQRKFALAQTKIEARCMTVFNTKREPVQEATNTKSVSFLI